MEEKRQFSRAKTEKRVGLGLPKGVPTPTKSRISPFRGGKKKGPPPTRARQKRKAIQIRNPGVKKISRRGGGGEKSTGVGKRGYVGNPEITKGF